MTVSIAANAADSRIQTFLLVKLDFASGTVYWTNCDQPIVTGSPARTDCAPAATWTPRPLRLSGVTSTQGQQSGAMLELGNADLVLSAILFGATNPAGTPVHVWEAWFDPTTTTAIPDDSTQLLEARIDQMRVKTTATIDTATIVLAAPVDFATRVFPRRRFTQKCSFIFKSAACQASDTSGTATFTNGSTSVTSVSPTLASVNCLVGATVKVGTFTGVVASNTTSAITLVANWGGSGGSQSFTAGDIVCDGTLTACSLTTKRSGNPVGGNKDNFGGFPMLPAMGM